MHPPSPASSRSFATDAARPSAPDAHRTPPRVADRAFPPEVFARRRQRVLAALRAAGGGIALIAAAPARVRSRDGDFPYRQDSDFFYLTGFTEPDALLLLDSRGAGKTEAPSSTLFCREKDPAREVWEGFHYGPDAARRAFGVDAALPNSARDTHLPACLDGAPTLFHPFHADTGLDADIARWIATVRGRRGHRAPASRHDLTPVIEAMRIVKDASELARMRAAAAISAQAHLRAMRAARPGLPEYALEAELLYEFRRHGAQAPAYGSIVAAGANACILHYPAGDKVLADGDLVLIDAACELDGYASDITRTFPANGRFSGPQRALYDIVVAANHAAAVATRPGARFDDAHQAALRVLVQGLFDTGLLRADAHGSVDDAIAARAYTRFYMHRTGHWLGLDVHDCGDYEERGETGDSEADAGATTPTDDADDTAAPAPPASRVLRAGMVLTIEPGLYVRRADDVPEAFWDIGIRVEDDAVVTEDGCELITRDVPVEADAIEALMREARC
ncbi:aminopeptidase P N-terminal domain-containing protein [Robbsia sp. Bb-Pol-6]|uniref:Xaa-Pro aminopeptidase n=1 Tax=Robbsia betulipollinis TaxID=2981849 RepID=A0ABT3ZLF6_9BURK|nr:aminopeptidase P N-terminal domain-containing protein [Robbsia betulipollinis]MCY0387364.1 aminopeptidase P N-terminal domain-containing protein [Robbsia betulipollinis]